MVVAKTDRAHRQLAHALAAADGSGATYAALAWGHLDASPTVIEARSPATRETASGWRSATGGRPARTDAYVVARFDVCDLLRLELHSGRTHQIRVHLEHIGHPVVGDPIYAGGGSRRIGGPARALAEAVERATPRQALHAAVSPSAIRSAGATFEFRVRWPADLMPALSAARRLGTRCPI